MLFKVVIFALSFMATSAYPLHRNASSREAFRADPKTNQAHDKMGLTKDMDKAYKSHVENSDLYTQEDNRNPMVEEMQRKLSMQSEQLHARLHQELAELRERLSPYPADPSSALTSMRERLAPLTQQLHSTISGNTQDLCGRLNLYLQGLEPAETQTADIPTLYQEAIHRMSQTVEHSGSKLAVIISDFHTQTYTMIQDLKESTDMEEEGLELGIWQGMNARLGQEVNKLRQEVQSRIGALKAELDALSVTAQPLKAEMAGIVDLFCQSTGLQNDALQAWGERLVLGLEKEIRGAPGVPYSASIQPFGSIQEDFSARLSALIQDILHSMQ